MRNNILLVTLFLSATLISFAEPEAGGHGHEEDQAGNHDSASFKEGVGLRLGLEAIETLGIKTSPSKEEMFAEKYEVSASVFDSESPAKANAIIPLEVAEKIKDTPQENIKVLGVKSEIYKALGLVEVLFEIPSELKVGSTLNLHLQGMPRNSILIPKSALLRTTEGTFVYVVSNEHYLRMPVTVGGSNNNYFEIKDGLKANTEIVSQGVEQLWLTELRFTKGGGH